ncbi:hypothetical protein UlMin_028414 [Ulmus minor]
MKSITSFCFVIVSALFLFQINTATADLITTACGTALDKKFCESSLRSQPESKKADLNGLARIALNLASTNGNKVQNQVSQLLKKESDKNRKAALRDCVENYQSALEQIKNSATALASKRYSDVNTWVSAAMSAGASCEEGFKSGQSPLTKSNSEFGSYCGTALAVTNKASGS